MWTRNLIAAALVGAIAPAAFAAEAISFGAMKPMAADAAKTQAVAWLKKVGKGDDKAVARIWAAKGTSTLDRVVDTLALGNAEVAKAMKAARAASASAPMAVPTALKDAKLPKFVRANLALGFARSLAEHRVYEQALEALKAVAAEDVVDPAAYFFYRAVAEHALMDRDGSLRSIVRLLDDVRAAPDRYKYVASMMVADIQQWPVDPKDLVNITKLMDNSERRLALARGGKKTQKIQKKILFRLDELIKKIENSQCNCQCNGGSCPKGGSKPGGGDNPNGPMPDSRIAKGKGDDGKRKDKKDGEFGKKWKGSMFDKERARAMAELRRDMPERFKKLLEGYPRALDEAAKGRKR